MRGAGTAWWVLLCACALVLAGATAQAQSPTQEASIEDADDRYTLAPPKGFTSAAPPAGSLARHYHKSERGIIGSVTRFDAANRAAFRKNRSAAFMDSIERGIRQSTENYRRRSRKIQRLHRVPSLDLEFTRTNGTGRAERVFMRMLFRHRFTLIATATIPNSAPRRYQRRAREYSRSLTPLRGH